MIPIADLNKIGYHSGMPDGEQLSVNDAGKVLGLGPRQIRKYIAAGVLPATMIGGTYVIRRTDLANVPTDRKRGPKPKPAAPAAKPRSIRDMKPPKRNVTRS
jgi:excisionase family DNA binding protein